MRNVFGDGPSNNPSYRHGYARRGTKRSREYSIWASMKSRCHNPKTVLHKWYGARGIAVAEEWRGPDGFLRFLAHIGERPGRGYSVDRIDNERGYEPGNVKWVTQGEQMLNTRVTVFVEFRGERRPLKTWCRDLGLAYQAVHQRVTYLGWSVDRALSTPIRQNCRRAA